MASIADGTHKPVQTGDVPSRGSQSESHSKLIKKNRRRAAAYRKVQRLGLEHESVKKYERTLCEEYIARRKEINPSWVP